MSDQNLDKDIAALSERLHVDIDYLREISPDEFHYLLDRCPYLQIVGPDVELNDPEPKMVEAQSGWQIHDYGDALSSSPGKLLFGGGDFKVVLGDDDEGGAGGRVLNPGKGTIRNQAVMTANEMMILAAERGWDEIEIVSGHHLMKRAAWIKAEQLGLSVSGFTPYEDDRRVKALVEKSTNDIEKWQKTTSPKTSL